ncbi:dihydrodipicolinate synthase family protein [Trueperella sp. LYQ143]|uniref:dihydrodipicolinate synthase family protein n=1 Tax=Trueperella sp. LYQ143 TaxID=3391059 RepID=UPI003982FA33
MVTSSSQPEFQGIIPYLVSPLTAENEVNETVLRQLVSYLIECGVHGLSPLGSTGEVMYLTQEQRERIVAITVDEAAGRVPVIPGIAAFSCHDAATQAQRMAALGANGLVAIQQHYFPVSASGIEQFFTAIATATDLPVVLYTNPRLNGGIPIDVVCRLAELPTVQYMKDASGVTGYQLSISNRLGDRIKFFSASAHIPASVMELGGVGWMAGPACVVPQAAIALWDAYQQGDHNRLWQLQRALWPINELFQKYSLAALIKAALSIRGFDVGAPIPPLSPIPENAWDECRTALAHADQSLT